MMFEMIVCTVLLATLATVLTPTMFAVHKQRGAMRFETLADLELQNMAADITAAEIANAESASKSLQPSPWFANRYPDAEFNVQSSTELQQATPDGLTAFTLTLRLEDSPTKAPLERSLSIWAANKNEPPASADPEKEEPVE